MNHDQISHSPNDTFAYQTKDQICMAIWCVCGRRDHGESSRSQSENREYIKEKHQKYMEKHKAKQSKAKEHLVPLCSQIATGN
jgi:hypothetical protein